MEDYLLHIGSYANEDQTGLHVYRLDRHSGALRRVQEVTGVINPSFFDISPDGRHLYAVNEVSEFGGREGGGVTAFARDPSSGELRPLNSQSSAGSGPCHVQVERTGRYVLVANYGSGSVAMLPVDSDGGLGPACSFVQHRGQSADPQRQAGPHAHSVTVDPTNTYAYAADLGLDQVRGYRMDLEAGGLIPLQAPAVATPPGSGPRHMAFHPHGVFAYLVTEMANTVIGLEFVSGRGELREFQTISTLPAGFAGTSYTAEVRLAPDGRFLYVSNRGHDSLAVFAVEEGSGRLELVDTPSCGGRFPRNFALSPDGNFLVAANQNSANVVVFRRDAHSGELSPTGHEVSLDKPVCVRVVEAV